MKKISLILIFALGLLRAGAQDSLVAKSETLFNDAISKGQFSGAAIITKNGQPVYQKQYGYADWQSKRPITDSSLYNIGSLTKLFTQELIHQLVKEGKLSESDPLSKYLDLFPKDIGDQITIEELLKMRSGLGDYFGSPEFHRLEMTDFNLNDILEIIKHEPLLFPPGKGEAYSNSGYAVLGAVIEKVTGKSYEQNLRERIAAPLGLKDIYYTKAEKATQAKRAFGHINGFDGNKQTTDDLSSSHPDGGIYTTAADLLKFTEARRTHTLPSGYAYQPGLFIGGTPPWNAMTGYGADDYSFVILCNLGESADRIGPRLSSILKGEPYPPLGYPMQITLYHLLNEKGITYIEQHIQDLCRQDGKPYDARFLDIYGHKLLLGRESKFAIQLFELNVKLFPKQPQVYDALAGVYLQTGDKEKAKQNYTKVLEIDPGNDRVRELLKNWN